MIVSVDYSPKKLFSPIMSKAEFLTGIKKQRAKTYFSRILSKNDENRSKFLLCERIYPRSLCFLLSPSGSNRHKTMPERGSFEVALRDIHGNIILVSRFFFDFTGIYFHYWFIMLDFAKNYFLQKIILFSTLHLSFTKFHPYYPSFLEFIMINRNYVIPQKYVMVTSEFH